MPIGIHLRIIGNHLKLIGQEYIANNWFKNEERKRKELTDLLCTSPAKYKTKLYWRYC